MITPYRRYLGANLGHLVTLESNDFIIQEKENKRMFLLLLDYEIKKISYSRCNAPKPKHNGHLWIEIPNHLKEITKDLCETSRKIRLYGRIYKYQTKGGLNNVSINLYNINQVKPKKKKKGVDCNIRALREEAVCM